MKTLVLVLMVAGCSSSPERPDRQADAAIVDASGADASSMDASLPVDGGAADATSGVDAMVVSMDGGGPTLGSCGNGTIDPGEVCDPALPDGGSGGSFAMRACVGCTRVDCSVYDNSTLDPVSGMRVTHTFVEEPVSHRCLSWSSSGEGLSGTTLASPWWHDVAERDRMLAVYRTFIDGAHPDLHGLIRVRSFDSGATWRWDFPSRPLAPALPPWVRGEPMRGFNCAWMSLTAADMTLVSTGCGSGPRGIFSMVEPLGTPDPS